MVEINRDLTIKKHSVFAYYVSGECFGLLQTSAAMEFTQATKEHIWALVKIRHSIKSLPSGPEKIAYPAGTLGACLILERGAEEKLEFMGRNMS